jgi:parallel beta-helix repeat protein
VLFLLNATPAAALVIDKDTVWSGERRFAEDVKVMPGATLTVSPGARVHFSAAGLVVAGALVADDAEFSGDKWDGVILKGNDGATRLTNCLIKGAKTGLMVQGGSPQLEKLIISENNIGLELRGKAAGRVIKSHFTGNHKVGLFIKDDSTTAVVDCRFEKNGRYGTYLYRSRPKNFAGNVFRENSVALIIAYHGSDAKVLNNYFENNEIAIQVDRSARPTLEQNLLRNNRTGVYAYRRSDPLVIGNRLEGNDVGILIAYSSYPQIEGNDFVDNKMALKLEYQSSQWEAERGAQARAGETATRTAFAGQGMRHVSEEDRKARSLDGMVNARGNWWGKAGLAELEETASAGNPSFIHDGRDQATFVDAGKEYPLDKVDYESWSKAPLVEATP